MDLVRVLNSVGKSTFVKYYYNFKDKSRDECIMLFDEDFTDKAKGTRTGHNHKCKVILCFSKNDLSSSGQFLLSFRNWMNQTI